jgi:hypothetical protein
MRLKLRVGSSSEGINKIIKLSSSESKIFVYCSFVERDGKDARAQNAKKDDNIVIGMSQGSYISEQRANYIDRDLKEAQTNSASIKAMNTEDHFKIGGTSGQAKVTTYQDEFRKDL